MYQFSPGPWVLSSLQAIYGQFRIFTKISGDIRNCMFIGGVSDTGQQFFPGVNDTVEQPQKRMFRIKLNMPQWYK